MALHTDKFGKIKPENLEKKTISKKFQVNDRIVTMEIRDALFCKEDGKEFMLDESSVDAMLYDIIKSLKSHYTKYNPIPESIVISHSNEGTLGPGNGSDFFALSGNAANSAAGAKSGTETGTETGSKLKPDSGSGVCFEPRWSIDDVCIGEAQKEQILSALIITKNKDKLLNEWGLGQVLKTGRSVILNFFGPPGTGKSMMAEAVANYLGKRVYLVNYAQLESKYVGETPKNIVGVFRKAKEHDAVLVFDEADSFLGKRLTNVSQSADYGVNITRSVMLMEIEKFDGVVIFTTNLIRNYDDAFKRRILANVRFELPDVDGRLRIWNTHIPGKLPLEGVTKEELAAGFDGITGADIKDIVLFASVLCIRDNRDAVTMEDFKRAYRYIVSRYSADKLSTHVENTCIEHEVITQEQYQIETGSADNAIGKTV